MMSLEDLISKYLEEGYSQEEAEEKAKEDLEEKEHLNWFRYQELQGNRRPWLSQKDWLNFIYRKQKKTGV